MQQLFTVLGGLALFVEFVMFGCLMEVLNDPGRVPVPGSGQILSLSGAPGDTLHFVLPVPGNSKADYSELTAQLRMAGPSAAEETVLPLHAELESSDSDDPDVYGTLVVPQVSAGTGVTGRLYGVVKLPGGKNHSLNAPIRLRVLADGEGKKSGTVEREQAITDLLVGIAVGVPLVFGLFWIAAFFEGRSVRQRTRQAERVAPLHSDGGPRI